MASKVTSLAIYRPPQRARIPNYFSRRTEDLAIYAQPCQFQTRADRQTIHTTPALQGGQAASFTKRPRRTHLATLLERARQEASFLKDTKAQTSEINERQRSSKLPDDIGLLKGTLVWPTGGSEKPFSDALKRYPWFSWKRSGFFTRWTLEARRAYKRFRDAMTCVFLLKEYQRGSNLQVVAAAY